MRSKWMEMPEEELPTRNPDDFDPNDSLEDLRNLSHEERKKQLPIYKKKLERYKFGVAEMQKKLIEAVRNDPDIQVSNLHEIVDGFAKNIGLDEVGVLYAMCAIDKYKKTHAAIAKVKKESSDDLEIFKKLFGFIPEGSIQIRTGPLTIHVKLNVSDYARVYTGTFNNTDVVSKKNMERVNKSSGAHVNKCLIPELTGAVTIEKISSRNPTKDENSTFDHEEHHALSDLFETDHQHTFSRLYPIVPKFTYEQKKAELIRYLKEIRIRSEERAKEEILAYLKGKSDPKRVYASLTRSKADGGLYDYLDVDRVRISTEFFRTELKQKGYLRNMPVKDNESEDEALASVMNELMDQVFGVEYKKLIRESIESAFGLKEKGMSEEEIIGLLIHEPLNHWKKLIGRLTLTK